MKKVYSQSIRILSRPLRWFHRTRRRNKILVILGIIVVVALLANIIGQGASNGQYVTESVTRSDIVQVVSETGEVSTGGVSPVYSPTNGVVDEVFVSNGNSVVSGEALFTVVSTATEQEAAAAYASYLQAQTAVDAAQASVHTLQSQMFAAWDAYRDYAEDHESDDDRREAEYIVLEKDWLAAESNYTNQQAVVSQAQAALSSAWLSYQATQNATVKASIDGTVANLSITPGASVQVLLPTAPVSPALTIANFAVVEVAVQLGESDISKVSPGQEVAIDVKAVDEHEYSGVVKRVDTVGNDIEGVTVYNTYVEILDPDTQLRPGMTADVDITTEKLADVLVVPNSAVKPYKGGRAVRVVGENGEIEYIPVRVGVRGVSETQILSGVEEGQEVITTLSNEQLSRPGLF